MGLFSSPSSFSWFISYGQKIGVLIPCDPVEHSSFILACQLQNFDINTAPLCTEDAEIIECWKSNRRSLSGEKYSYEYKFACVSFPFSVAFTRPIGIKERLVALANDWATSMNMIVFCFKDTVMARHGSVLGGNSNLLLLDVVERDDNFEAIITITFARRVEDTGSSNDWTLYAPMDFIGKISELVGTFYRGLAVTTQTMCTNCDNALLTWRMKRELNVHQHAECRSCREITAISEFNQWPRFLLELNFKNQLTAF